MLQSEGKFAVVGLPCHIQGIRKAQKHVRQLRDRIWLCIGIACSLNYSFAGTRRLLGKLGIEPRAVERLEYRGQGWPGGMRVTLKDGKQRQISLAEYFGELRPFSMRRCTLCGDAIAELADLALGDAWIPAVMARDQSGTSFVVARTREAMDLLAAADSAQVIHLEELSVTDLLKSQGDVSFKKKCLRARMFLFRLLAKKVPSYGQDFVQPQLRDYVNAVKFYVARCILRGDDSLVRRLFEFHQRRRRAAVHAETPS